MLSIIYHACRVAIGIFLHSKSRVGFIFSIGCGSARPFLKSRWKDDFIDFEYQLQDPRG